MVIIQHGRGCCLLFLLIHFRWLINSFAIVPRLLGHCIHAKMTPSLLNDYLAKGCVVIATSTCLRGRVVTNLLLLLVLDRWRLPPIQVWVVVLLVKPPDPIPDPDSDFKLIFIG